MGPGAAGAWRQKHTGILCKCILPQPLSLLLFLNKNPSIAWPWFSSTTVVLECWLWEAFQSRGAHGSAAHEDWSHPEYLKLFKLWSLLLKNIYEHWSIACTNLHISNIDCICIKEPPWGRSSDPQMCVLKFCHPQAQVCVRLRHGEPDELAWRPLWPYATVYKMIPCLNFLCGQQCGH